MLLITFQNQQLKHEPNSLSTKILFGYFSWDLFYTFSDPSSVRNLQVTNITSGSVTLKWDPALHPNGIIKEYSIAYTKVKFAFRIFIIITVVVKKGPSCELLSLLDEWSYIKAIVNVFDLLNLYNVKGYRKRERETASVETQKWTLLCLYVHYR